RILKNLLDRVSQLRYPFSLPERLKVDNTVQFQLKGHDSFHITELLMHELDKDHSIKDLFDSYELMVWSFVDVERQEFLFYFPRQCHSSRNSSFDQCGTECASPEVHLCLNISSAIFLSFASLMVSDTSFIMSCDTFFISISSSSEA
ncbi:hypothetical protein Tco_0904011, partial [Tanacetum coccineum]